MLVFTFPFSFFIIPPPLRSSPCLRGTKRVFRRLTKCPSVPREGRNLHCDAGERHAESDCSLFFGHGRVPTINSFPFSALT